MADENKPDDRKNVCYRRGDTPPPLNPASASANHVDVETNEHVAKLKQSIPIIISIIIVFFLALKLKSCVMPEKHVNVVNDYTVYSSEQLQSALNTAKNQKKPVMIEFFADWCGYCKKLEREYLSLESVQLGLQSFITIRMDVSDQTEDQEQIMKNYGVNGTPMLIFVNKNGEVDSKLSFTYNIRQNLLNKISQLK